MPQAPTWKGSEAGLEASRIYPRQFWTVRSLKLRLDMHRRKKALCYLGRSSPWSSSMLFSVGGCFREERQLLSASVQCYALFVLSLYVCDTRDILHGDSGFMN